MCACVGSAAPDLSTGGDLAMEGIQQGYRDLILQEGPLTRTWVELGPGQQMEERGRNGDTRMEIDFVPLESVHNDRL